MEKKEKIKKVNSSHPWKYPKDVVEKVLCDIKQGKTLNELLLLYPCRCSCLKRIARKHSLVIRKDKK